MSIVFTKKNTEFYSFFHNFLTWIFFALYTVKSTIHLTFRLDFVIMQGDESPPHFTRQNYIFPQ